MIRSSANASMSPIPSPGRRWPLTTEAWNLLGAELVRLADDVAWLATAGPDEDAASHLVHLRAVQAGKRFERLRAVLADAGVDDDPGRVVIGRRVKLREDDGARATYALVAPGDGDPCQGWISADCPLGSAILNCRAGDTVEIAAPAGRRLVTVEWVG